MLLCVDGGGGVEVEVEVEVGYGVVEWRLMWASRGRLDFAGQGRS